jgi:toxin-antitoxin system PIN domain toxin
MKLADVNVWLALTLSAHKFSNATQEWLNNKKPGEVLFCRATQQSFLRLLTTEAVCKSYGLRAFSNQDAWSLYQKFLADARISYAQEPEGLETQWEALASLQTASPKVWMDAYLAAFAISGGYQFVTTDNDFKQFNGLQLLLLSV